MNAIPGKKGKSLKSYIVDFGDNLLFILFAAMVVLVFSNVVARIFFDVPIIQSDELARYCFIWLCFIGAVSALNNGEHIGLDLVIKRLPDRVQKIVLLFANFCMLTLAGICSWYGWIIAARSFNQMSAVTPIRYGYVAVIMPISFFAMCLILSKNIVQLIRNGR